MSTPWEKCWEGHGRIQVHTHANTQARKLKKKNIFRNSLRYLGWVTKIMLFFTHPNVTVHCSVTRGPGESLQCTAMVSLEIKASWAWDLASWYNLCTLLWIYPCLCIYSQLWLWRIARKKSLKASQVSRNQFAIFPRNVFANSQRYTPIPW